MRAVLVISNPAEERPDTRRARPAGAQVRVAVVVPSPVGARPLPPLCRGSRGPQEGGVGLPPPLGLSLPCLTWGLGGGTVLRGADISPRERPQPTGFA